LWHLHRNDTLKGGDYYNIPELVEAMVKAAPDGLNWLIHAGAKIKETLPCIGGHLPTEAIMKSDLEVVGS
jgi:urocanate reductase